MEEKEKLARIRLISRRFNQLQGLRLVVFGLAFGLPFGAHLALGTPSEDSLYIAFGVAFVLMVLGMIWADRFYSQAFGRVHQTRPDGTRLGFAFGIGFAVLMLLERYFIGEKTMVSVFVVNVAVFASSAVREWPWMRHHLFGAATGVLAIVLQLTTDNAANLPDAIAAGFVLQGAVCIPLGFMDHQLLSASMRAAHEAPDEESASS
jgi:hypothetical protein